MFSVEEIKKRVKMSNYTDVFGISNDEFYAVSAEVYDLFEKIFEKRPNYTELAIAILEEVLMIDDYTPEQLLRLSLFLKYIHRMHEFVFRNAIAQTLVDPAFGEGILSMPASYEVVCPESGIVIPKAFCSDCPLKPKCDVWRED